MSNPIRAIAFYLPQFHPVPENDEWWGKGFTEWTNVAKARPAFAGHYQPHLPADLGFYDLRLPEARQAQADLAREYGLHGFCYYHYWFNGRRILERPFNEVLASGQPDFPFCLCWANENWTRRWDGQEHEILLKQIYSREHDLDHIRSLIPSFKDPRYIKVHGKPFFLVYQIEKLPEPAETIKCWREEAARAGLPGLFLANVESFPSGHGAAARLPLDAGVEFAPDWQALPPPTKASLLTRGLARIPSLQRVAEKLGLTKPWLLQHRVHSYRELMDNMMAKREPEYLRFSCVTPSWDNAARRRVGATILHGCTPEIYQEWLTKIVRKTQNARADESIVFINAWNEWGEGNHLEPCQKWGRACLEATRRVLSSQS